MHGPHRRRSARVIAAMLATGALMAVGLVSPAAAGHGHAYGHLKGHCRTFHATGSGTDNGDGTTSATLYQGKREVGSTEGMLTPGDSVEGVLPFAGTIVLTTSKGTLEATVEGTFDTVTGEFSARSVDVSGKGPLKNATGRLRVVGTQDLVAGTFTEVVRARVCVPKRRH